MENMHSKKKRRLLPIFAFSMVTVLTSCNLFTRKVWKWEDSTSNGTINYCLLIGQLDHNDSMFRTLGTRTIMNTRVDKEQQKDNYNLEGTKQGKITLAGDKDKGIPAKEFVVNELEHLEQKSFSGATWDPITANGTAGTWISKHGKNITMFVSNNDGMAEGAIKAHNWYSGMPIFGYDANASTLKLMLQDKIKGTIDSNTPAQCLATSLIIRNIVNASRKGHHTLSLIDAMAKEGKKYDPTGEGSGFDAKHPFAPIKVGNESYAPYARKGTHMQSNVNVDSCDINNFEKLEHAILLNNRTVTNDRYVPSDEDPDGVKTSTFFKADGSDLNTQEKYELSEGDKDPSNPTSIKFDSVPEKISVWQSWYSDTDTFFSGNMDPYFNLTQGENMFNFEVTPAKSNGSDESKNLNALESALAKQQYDAFLINPVQQSNSIEYIKKIADKKGLTPQDDWFKRDNTPIIFWNRQPTDRHGKLSIDDVMNNKYFKYVYYVGFDAKQGGELQGKMVRAWLNKAYIANYYKE